MPSIGGPELIFILVIVLIVFGAGKLPTVLGQLGKGIRSFRDEAESREKPAPPVSSSTSTTAPSDRPEGS